MGSPVELERAGCWGVWRLGPVGRAQVTVSLVFEGPEDVVKARFVEEEALGTGRVFLVAGDDLEPMYLAIFAEYSEVQRIVASRYTWQRESEARS